ncbi:MAG TPA: glycoside hydrolase family 2 TIM barrel-domain containing protein [Balneolales bacterium]|nr:glycoside hydrolase family 2 TIM barrel-domain containing protein [Balneolales bacterium]
MNNKNNYISIITLGVFSIILFCKVSRSKAQAILSNQSSRYVRTIDAHWRFIRQDVANGASIGLNDQSWKFVNLPHTWNDKDAFTDTRGYYRGPAWYRKKIFVSNQNSGKEIFLKFGAANQLADVFVNGHHAITHKGGYTAFAVNITKWVHFGEPNVVAVRVDNSYNNNIPPLSADFTFFGGLYRNAFMIVTNPVHIAVTDFASPGVFVHTSDVSHQKATVHTKVDLVNNSDQSQSVTLENVVENADGQSVSRSSQSVELTANESKSVSVTLPEIKNPHLWSPKNPYLYSVKTIVRENGKNVDEKRNPLGIRWYRFDPNKGFFLNGKHLRLKGVNRHQSYPGLGNAVPGRLHIQDLKMIKNMGANFIRLTHYPQASSVLRAADKLGILIWQESPNVNYIHVSKSYTDNAEQALHEMILQDYNHPSIILWGFMNEILLRHDYGRKLNHLSESDYDQKIVDLAKKLNNLAHRLDHTRKTTMAMHQSSLYDKCGLSKVTDVDGWNLYQGWYGLMYNKNGTNMFGKYLDDQHKKYPNRVMIVSEYGAGSDSRIHTYHPKRFDFSVEYQNQYHEKILNQIRKRPFISGSTLWVMYDFASEGRNDTRPWINEKGLVSQNRKPKEVYYFYKARFSDQPVVHIASHDWTHRTVPYREHNKKDFKRNITIFSNLSSVRLRLNGRSIGVKHPGKNDVTEWSVPFTIGENQLVAEGKTDGKTYTDEVTIHVSYRGDFNETDHNVPQLLVNAGSHFQFYPRKGVIWESDQSGMNHDWGYSGGKVGHTSSNIIGTSSDPVYQYYRVGMENYHFKVPKGKYAVTIDLAEPKYGIKGRRIFSVSANSTPVFTNVDLAGTYGKDVPVKHRVIIDVDDTNGITINFNARTGKAIVNGIEIRRL